MQKGNHPLSLFFRSAFPLFVLSGDLLGVLWQHPAPGATMGGGDERERGRG